MSGPSVEVCKQKVQDARGAGSHPLLKLSRDHPSLLLHFLLVKNYFGYFSHFLKDDMKALTSDGVQTHGQVGEGRQAAGRAARFTETVSRTGAERTAAAQREAALPSARAFGLLLGK